MCSPHCDETDIFRQMALLLLLSYVCTMSSLCNAAVLSPDMHAKPVVDRSSIWEEDGSPDSASRVPNIGDIDMSTVNRLLYQVIGSPVHLLTGSELLLRFPLDEFRNDLRSRAATPVSPISLTVHHAGLCDRLFRPNLELRSFIGLVQVFINTEVPLTQQLRYGTPLVCCNNLHARFSQEPTRKGSSRGGIPRRRRDWASPTPRPSQRGSAGEQIGYNSRRQDGAAAEFVGSG